MKKINIDLKITARKFQNLKVLPVGYKASLLVASRRAARQAGRNLRLKLKALSIKNWDKIYENNRTRELKGLRWIPIPIKLAGDGYTNILDKPNGEALFGAWIACVEVAGTCVPKGCFNPRSYT